MSPVNHFLVLGSFKGSLYKVLGEYTRRMCLHKPKLKCMLKNVNMFLNMMLDSSFFGLTVVSTSYCTVPPTMSSGFYKKNQKVMEHMKDNFCYNPL